ALAIAAGFAVAASFTVGFSFESLTAARKLVIAGLCSCVAALVLEQHARLPVRRAAWALGAVVAACSVWMLWRVLAQMEWPRATATAAASALFVLVAVAGSLHAARMPARGLAAATVLALGAGVLAVF